MLNPNRIIEMANAFYESCVLFTASDLGIFAKLGEIGQANAQTLASVLHLDQRGAKLLLDACVALELLRKDRTLYSNTPEAVAFLVPSSPGDLSGAIRYNRDVYPAWGRLKDFVKNGKPVENPEVHLGQDSERTHTFVMAMHYRALAIGQAVVPLLDLAGRKALLDVGSGAGTYSVLIAQTQPEIQCTMLDLPQVVAIADELVRRQGMQEQVKALPGDYRTINFPTGNDVINFFGVLHQESPESIRDLLQKAYASLAPGGIVNVMDMMTDDTHTKPKFSALFAVNMALTTDSGWVFAGLELKQWLEEAGFVECTVKTLPPPMPHWLVTAHKKQ